GDVEILALQGLAVGILGVADVGMQAAIEQRHPVRMVDHVEGHGNLHASAGHPQPLRRTVKLPADATEQTHAAPPALPHPRTALTLGASVASPVEPFITDASVINEVVMDRPLEGQVAVVAGATRGAGRGIARALGAAGATVYCTGRSAVGASGGMD